MQEFCCIELGTGSHVPHFLLLYPNFWYVFHIVNFKKCTYFRIKHGDDLSVGLHGREKELHRSLSSWSCAPLSL